MSDDEKNTNNSEYYVKILLVVIIIILLIAVFYNNGNNPLQQRLATTEAELQELKAKFENISAENKKLTVFKETLIKLQADISNLIKEKREILKKDAVMILIVSPDLQK